MSNSLRRQPAIEASLAEQFAPFPRVSLPVDVSDAEAFPEIAAAIEWARKQKDERHG